MIYTFKALIQDDIPSIVATFTAIGWNKPTSIYEQYFQEQRGGQRHIWIARQNNTVLGYVTLKWQSDYPLFKMHNIPEINDLNVLPVFRKQGIGSKLLDYAEAEARGKSHIVGLGVGLYADYGDAQKLYVKRGYIPDGHGITYNNNFVNPGSTVQVDDDLILWLTKSL